MSRDPDAGARLKARGLRIALAVTGALAVEALRGSDLPILAPLIALQILAMAPRPPGAKQLAALFGAAAVSSLAAWAVAAFTVSVPGAYPLGMGALYLWGFALAMHPRTRALGAMGLTMIIVVGALSAASTEAAAGIAFSLVLSILAGAAAVYAGFAALPGPPPAPGAPADPDADDDLSEPAGPPQVPVAVRAALATAVILPLHLWLTADGGVAAMPVLFTCSAMLRQPGAAASVRDALARLAGTAAGGVLAAGVHAASLMHGEATLALAMATAVSLFFAWRMSVGPLHAQVWLPGFVTFLALYGMTLSPTLGGDEVAASERLVQVFAGALYTVAAVSLLAPAARRLMGPRAARPA